MNTFQSELESDPQSEAVSNALLMRKDNPQLALRVFEDLAAKGSIISYVALGDIYAYGRYGNPSDLEKAECYLSKAKEMGSVEAAYRLARLFQHLGNSRKYIDELTCLSGKGFSPASFLLGDIFYNGRIVDQDIDKAYLYFEESSRQGHLVARQWVGHLTRKRGGLMNKIKGTLIIAATAIPMLRANQEDPQCDELRNW